MNWEIFITPLLGALIGYVTNKIAVEMLFKPLKPVYIGKFHVPFTPGVIPKEKGRFGKAIGNAVGQNLLTTESIKDTLCSEKMEKHIEEQLDELFIKFANDPNTLKSKLDIKLGKLTTARIEVSVKDTVTKRVSNGIQRMNLGEIIAEEVLDAVTEKVQGTMLAMMLDTPVFTQMVDEIKLRINQYIAYNGEEKIGEFIDSEFSTFLELPTSSFFEKIDTEELKNIILSFYRSIVINYSDTILDTINLSNIVEEKINDMDILEVEKLVLSIMEKELGAVVNLGALIGFVLGTLKILL